MKFFIILIAIVVLSKGVPLLLRLVFGYSLRKAISSSDSTQSKTTLSMRLTGQNNNIIELQIDNTQSPRSITGHRISIDSTYYSLYGPIYIDNFDITEDRVLSYEEFEPDLKPLLDSRKNKSTKEPSEQEIEEYTRHQYDEYLENARKYNRESVHWNGKIIVPARQALTMQLKLSRPADLLPQIAMNTKRRTGAVWSHDVLHPSETETGDK